MIDPFKSLIDTQLALYQSWANSATTMLRYWGHLADLQHDFLCKHAVAKRDHVEIAKGASLTEKYGKRAHDIDPERDL